MADFKTRLRAHEVLIGTLVTLGSNQIDAVRQIDKISTVRGLDAIFIGPMDLSASLGVAGAVDDLKVQEAISRVIENCKEHSVTVGIYARDCQSAKDALSKGITPNGSHDPSH